MEIYLHEVEALATLQLGKKIRTSDIAKATGYTENHLYAIRKAPLSPEIIETFENALKIKLKTKTSASDEFHTMNDMFEIPYWEGCKNFGDKFIHPEVRSKWGDKEMLVNIWGKDPNAMRIIAMAGDRMDGGRIPLKPKDILCIDTSEKCVAGGGIYFLTTNNNKNAFVATISKQFDGSFRAFFTNELYKDDEIIVTKEKALEMGIKIIGRVIFNYSHTL